MVDSTERLVNLAMFLAASHAPVSAEHIRAEVEGYAPDQDDAAFLRMFERDKKALRAAGLIIEADAQGRYRLEAGATFAAAVALSEEEAAAIRVAGLALLDDPSFPFAADIRLALAKISAMARPTPLYVPSHLASEDPRAQGDAVALLADALSARKTVAFEYTNARGEHRDHVLEPYGLFVLDGRWYLVGRDTHLDEVRVYAVVRMRVPKVNGSRPETPDFTPPEGFDVASFIALPFQYGDDEFQAVVGFDPNEAWRAPALVRDVGALDSENGSLRWRVVARDRRRLMRWVVENGPGISIVEPSDLADELRESLDRVVELHG